jgi:putative ABC transport system permease protein
MENTTGATTFSQSLLDSVNSVKSVEQVSAFYMRRSTDSVYYQNTVLSGAKVVGVDENYMSVNSYVIKYGRGFAQSDFSKIRKVCLIDASAVQSLFGGKSAVGKVLEINGEPFSIVGVYDTATEFTPTVNSISDYYNFVSADSSGTVIIPMSAWSVPFGYDEPQSLCVKATSTDTMTTAGNAVAQVLNNFYGLTAASDYQFKGDSIMEKAVELQALSDSANKQLIWIAIIALIVGGIGVVNIMLVSVSERTNEIGLKKALGAKKSRILLQFLVEACVLTLTGGILGIIIGIVLSYIIGAVSSVPISISAWSVLLSVGVSVLVGIIFGILPAIKASRLNPIEALQRE